MLALSAAGDFDASGLIDGADLAAWESNFGSTLWIDTDAAGHGWYLDQTPWDDIEFQVVADRHPVKNHKCFALYW